MPRASAKILVLLCLVVSDLLFGPDAVRVFFARPGEPAFDEARNLLYQVYVQEQGWLTENDPTGIRVEQGAFGSMLVNDYDPVSIRAVAYVGKQCVGTLRLAGMLNDRFEVEHYIPLPPMIAGMKAADPQGMLEVNRLAIHPDFRNRRVAFYREIELVADALFDATAVFRARYILFGAPNEDLAESAGKRWMGMRFHEPYRYHPTDPTPVSFVVALRGWADQGTLFTRRLEPKYKPRGSCQAYLASLAQSSVAAPQ